MTDQPNVLFITDNGHGLGHLTRMMAVARRAGDRFRPFFLTLSQAYPLVRELGWVVEYLPSYVRLGMTTAEWQPIFASRLVDLLRHIKPRVVVIDHIRPAPILGTIKAQSQGITFVWSRRGMWRERHNIEAIHNSGYFDAIIEPGDLAGPIDMGLTYEYRQNVTSLAPVVFVGREEQRERDSARHALGIPLEGKAILIQLSHSDATRLSALIGKVRDVVTSVAGDKTIHFFAPLHVLHRGAIPAVDGVIMRLVYPMATYLQAFDGVISNAGYNSFHEVVASRLPAVFVARDAATLDDQARRAGFAELCGRGFVAPTVHDDAFRLAVSHMVRPEEFSIAERVTEALGQFDGAEQFADLIAAQCEARRGEHTDVSESLEIGEPLTNLLARMPSGRDLPDDALADAKRVIVVALELDSAALASTASQAAELQERTHGFKPIFLVDDTDTQSLDDFGFQYEAIMSPQEYEDVGSVGYEDYVQTSIEGARFRYQAERVVTLAPDQPLDPALLSSDQAPSQ